MADINDRTWASLVADYGYPDDARADIEKTLLFSYRRVSIAAYDLGKALREDTTFVEAVKKLRNIKFGP